MNIAWTNMFHCLFLNAAREFICSSPVARAQSLQPNPASHERNSAGFIDDTLPSWCCSLNILMMQAPVYASNEQARAAHLRTQSRDSSLGYVLMVQMTWKCFWKWKQYTIWKPCRVSRRVSVAEEGLHSRNCNIKPMGMCHKISWPMVALRAVKATFNFEPWSV